MRPSAMMATDTPRFDIGHRPVAHQLVALAGVLLASGVLLAVAGPIGATLAITVGIAWYLFPPYVAFATGQVVFIVLLPETESLLPLVLGEAGLCGVLFASVFGRGLVRAGIGLLGFGVVLGTVTWLGVSAGGLWLGMVALVCSVGSVAYIGHRYGRVRLGLVKSS